MGDWGSRDENKKTDRDKYDKNNIPLRPDGDRGSLGEDPLDPTGNNVLLNKFKNPVCRVRQNVASRRLNNTHYIMNDLLCSMTEIVTHNELTWVSWPPQLVRDPLGLPEQRQKNERKIQSDQGGQKYGKVIQINIH